MSAMLKINPIQQNVLHRIISQQDSNPRPLDLYSRTLPLKTFTERKSTCNAQMLAKAKIKI